MSIIVSELRQMVLDSGVNEEIIGDKLDEMVHDIKAAEAARVNNGAVDESSDDAVHDAKSAEASEINNGGFGSQIEYLFGEETPEAARATMQQMIDEAKTDRG